MALDVFDSRKLEGRCALELIEAPWDSGEKALRVRFENENGGYRHTSPIIGLDVFEQL
jgi:hypothetical protein